MSRLLLIRHGQASLMRSDYDQLSELGYTQSRALGRHLVEQEIAPTRVYVGPLKRHRQTLEAAREAFEKEGIGWPEPVELEGLREYSAFKLVYAVLPEVQRQDPEVARLVESLGDDAPTDPRLFRRVFQKISADWAAGLLGDVEGIGTWAGFRSRVEDAVAAIREASGSGEVALAFSSGGPVAAAVGHALGLDGLKTMELTWVLENASVSELLFSSNRLSLQSFNRTPHLADPGLRTMV